MRLFLVSVAVLGLAACGSQQPTADTVGVETTQPVLNPLPDPPDAAPIDASYTCEGNRVDLINERGTARIAMNDGRVVSLGGMRGSTPETWRDVGLTFSIDNRPATPVIELAQDNGPVLGCESLQDESYSDAVQPSNANNDDAAELRGAPQSDQQAN